MNSKEIIESGIERAQMNEDIWSVVKWILARLGVSANSKFADYKAVDVSKVAYTVTGAANKALRRTLTKAERNHIEVIPVIKKKVIMTRINVNFNGSNLLADKVVKYLVNMGGRVI